MAFPLTQTQQHDGQAAPARTASILGLGHYLPEEVVPNDPIAERIGVDDEWIVRRTGIRSRRRAAPDERLIDLAANAGAQALQDAHTDPEEIDLVLVASLSQDQLTPNAAPVVAHALGAHRRPPAPGRRTDWPGQQRTGGAHRSGPARNRLRS